MRQLAARRSVALKRATLKRGTKRGPNETENIRGADKMKAKPTRRQPPRFPQRRNALEAGHGSVHRRRRRRVRLDPRDPDFFNDPYPAYAAIREASPVFFWEDYGFWCFARFADVSALLRDRRFGRITHLSSRAESARVETAS